MSLKKGWNIDKARKAINTERDLKSFIKPILYRPFDTRLIFYHSLLVWSSAFPTMQHLLDSQNLAFVWTRPMRPDFEFSITCTRHLIDQCSVGNKSAGAGISHIAPIYLYPTEKEKAFGATERVPNFSDEFIEEFSNKLGLEFKYEVGTLNGEVKINSSFSVHHSSLYFSPEDVFAYAYAVFHSPTYRSRYAEFLKIDFPRLPLTTSRELFRQLCSLGAELVNAHLLESVDAPPAWNLHTEAATLFQTHEVAAGFPKYEDGKVFINKTTYFNGVPEPVWNFHIGGYQVCHKWLKDRKARTLSAKDIAHYGKIAVALAETIRLMTEIDETIGEHGGFPLVGSQT
jgi:predicted helicase